MVAPQTRCAIFVAYALLATGCGWNQRFSFVSPTNNYRLEVARPRVMPDSDMRLDLVAGNGTRFTLYRAGQEMALTFAYTYWSPTGDKLGFVGCGGNSVVQIAYDLTNHEPLAFEKVADAVRAGLLRDYPKPTGLDATLDPLSAACIVVQWREEFERRNKLNNRS